MTARRRRLTITLVLLLLALSWSASPETGPMHYGVVLELPGPYAVGWFYTRYFHQVTAAVYTATGPPSYGVTLRLSLSLDEPRLRVFSPPREHHVSDAEKEA
jgi:hypothetical protein